MNMYFKKRIATLCIVLMAVITMAAVPNRTYAYWGILDTSFDFSAVATAIQGYAQQAAQWVRENWQKTMRDVIAKRIIDYTVDETVKWVQGGGDPKFVTDWNGFMKEAGGMAFDSTIKEMGVSDICQPFAFQLKVALLPEKRFNKERVNCSISDIVANVQDFYNNFQNGGWLAYGESVKPENNLYMQLVMFDDEIKTRTSFNEDVKRQKANSGQGFLSVATCTEDDWQELYDACIADGGDDAYCRDSADQGKTCTKEEVQTPGSMVGKALGESITSDTQWAANIESWTSALVNAAINRVTKEGVKAMTGSKAGAAASYDPATSEYGDVKTAEITEYQKERITQVENITIPYQKFIAEKENAKTYTEQILDLFTQMKNMDPGKICVPQVTDAEVAAQQAILDRLNKEIAPVKPTVTEGNAIIAKLKTMNTSIRNTAISASLVTDFVAKHSATEQADMQSKLQNLTDSTAQGKTLQDVQSRFLQCKNKVAPAP